MEALHDEGDGFLFREGVEEFEEFRLGDADADHR
jgi:hypothetical protein